MSDSFDRLLGRTERRDAAPRGTCPDPDVLAAYLDGTLTPTERATVEGHAADCARCALQLATIVRLEDESGQPQHAPASPWRARTRWLVPAAAAAVVVAIYVVLPSPKLGPLKPAPAAPAPHAAAGASVPSPPAAAPLQAEKVDAARSDTARLSSEAARRAVADSRAEATAAARGRDQLAKRAPLAVQDVPQEQRPAAKAEGAVAGGVPAPPPLAPPAAQRSKAAASPSAEQPVAGLPAAPPPAVAAEARARASDASLARRVASLPVVIHAQRGETEWRVTGAVIERSTDGGRTWSAERAPAAAGLTMGAAPTAEACWLASPLGQVLRRTEAGGWLDVSPAPRIPIAHIDATTPLAATIVGPDGTTWATADGGTSWTRPDVGRD